MESNTGVIRRTMDGKLPMMMMKRDASFYNLPQSKKHYFARAPVQKAFLLVSRNADTRECSSSPHPDRLSAVISRPLCHLYNFTYNLKPFETFKIVEKMIYLTFLKKLLDTLESLFLERGAGSGLQEQWGRKPSVEKIKVQLRLYDQGLKILELIDLMYTKGMYLLCQ